MTAAAQPRSVGASRFAVSARNVMIEYQLLGVLEFAERDLGTASSQ